jgi:hypothetical protein
VFIGEPRGMFDVLRLTPLAGLWLDFECKFHNLALIILVQFTKVVQK